MSIVPTKDVSDSFCKKHASVAPFTGLVYSTQHPLTAEASSTISEISTVSPPVADFGEAEIDTKWDSSIPNWIGCSSDAKATDGNIMATSKTANIILNSPPTAGSKTRLDTAHLLFGLFFRHVIVFFQILLHNKFERNSRQMNRRGASSVPHRIMQRPIPLFYF